MIPAFKPEDPSFETRVRASFARQTLMKTIGASVTKVVPGEVEIALPFRADLSQQHGFIHGGIITALVDTACGYAALSLMPSDASVLTVEFKVNLIAVARGERFIARGRVVKPGRVLTVCAGEVVALTEGNEKSVALMQTTMMALHERDDLPSGM